MAGVGGPGGWGGVGAGVTGVGALALLEHVMITRATQPAASPMHSSDKPLKSKALVDEIWRRRDDCLITLLE